MKRQIVESLCAPQGEFAAFVAIDWADQRHAWRMQVAGSAQQERGTVEHRPERIEEWVAGLRDRFSGRRIAVCLEQSRGPLVYALAKYDHLVLFPVHPTTAARYRASFAPSGAKNDDGDAACLLDLLLRHSDKLTVWNPDTVETRSLQMFTEHRRDWVDQRTACSNRLRALLKLYYPQVLDWFEELAAPVVVGWLTRWPSLESLQRAKPATVRRFLESHGSRRADAILASLAAAVAATTDGAVLTTSSKAVAVLVRQIQLLHATIAEYDAEIASLAQAHPDAPIVFSFPGAGPALGPRLLAALGTPRERFQTARQLQCWSRIAPVTEQSGASQWVHVRRACPRFVRQTFHEWAACTRMRSHWAREFYDRKRASGMTHHAAIRALAFKWLRILFRCWKDRVPYLETLHLASSRVPAPSL